MDRLRQRRRRLRLYRRGVFRFATPHAVHTVLLRHEGYTKTSAAETLDAATAIDLHDVAGKEFGLGGGQEQSRIGDVLRQSEPAHRNCGDELLAHARRWTEKGWQQRRFGGYRRDGADADAVRGELDRERFGQNMDGAFGGVI